MNEFAELARSASEKFSTIEEMPAVAVVGDFLIDVHRLCTCERIAQESPIPVWKQVSHFLNPGGAAGVACFARDLDCRVNLISAVGVDTYSGNAVEVMKQGGIDCESVARLRGWTPSVKTRIWTESPGSVLMLAARMDTEDNEFPVERFNDGGQSADPFRGADGVIVADYGKGFVIPSLLRIPEGVQTFVDPAPGLRGDLRAIYAGRTDWLILNETEFEGLEFGGSGPGNLIRKRDRSGVVVLTDDGETLSLPGIVDRPRYVSGAGDMFIAAFAAATCCGLTPGESAAVGHLAAALLIRDVPFDRKKIDRELIYEFACELSESVSE